MAETIYIYEGYPLGAGKTFLFLELHSCLWNSIPHPKFVFRSQNLYSHIRKLSPYFCISIPLLRNPIPLSAFLSPFILPVKGKSPPHYF
jgi:hypothetical protein